MKLLTFFHLYTDGFRQMTWGRILWMIILVKLFIMFAILKVFFFPNLLKTLFETDQERSEYVSEEFSRRVCQ
ncbi:MAG: DUF4492 domain-containing protein [Dysgonamonadaceae bacterium]|jgi:hypothetical protein|nr:DUF4492 domain-containing protein [Dysgonamonadaceae bacterium]